MNPSISHYPADAKRARTRLRLIQISARANYSSLHSRTKWRWPTVHGVPVLSSVECFDLYMENRCIISLQPVVHLEYRRSHKSIQYYWISTRYAQCLLSAILTLINKTKHIAAICGKQKAEFSRLSHSQTPTVP